MCAHAVVLCLSMSRIRNTHAPQPEEEALLQRQEHIVHQGVGLLPLDHPASPLLMLLLLLLGWPLLCMLQLFPHLFRSNDFESVM